MLNEMVSLGSKVNNLTSFPLNRWAEVSIPAWRRILNESIEAGDQRREQYARWMLKEVLEAEVNK